MPPVEPTEEERQQELPEDNQTPFQPADPNPSPAGNTTDPVVENATSAELPADHPATDSNVDTAEVYDEGLSGATETVDNSGQTAVTGLTDQDAAADAEDIEQQAL